MTRKELEDRTRKFYVNVLKLCQLLPKNSIGFEISKQLVRAGGSVAANYRASGRAKSDADFEYKMAVVLEETDESLYWLQSIRDSELLNCDLLFELLSEADELTRIFSAANKTLKAKSSKRKRS
jgi:four helix bundle protein